MAESPRCSFARSDGINDFLLSSLLSERSTNVCLNLSAFHGSDMASLQTGSHSTWLRETSSGAFGAGGKTSPTVSVRAHSKGKILTNTSHNPPLFVF